MNQVDWLLVGAGDVAGKRVASALTAAQGSRLSAICDPELGRACDLAAKYGCEKVYGDLAKALDESGAMAVYVATPVHLHVSQAVASLSAGKHVLVEKPLALNSQECHLAVEKANATGLVAACAYFRRFYPCYSYTRELLNNGELGKVIHARMTYHSWANPDSRDSKHWRVIKRKGGGGPLFDMGSHMIDVLVGLLGIPRLVYGREKTLTQSYEVEDSAEFLMELQSHLSVIGSFHWNSKSWCHEFEIVGTEGRIKWAPYDSGKVWKTIGRETSEVNLPNAGNVHLPLIQDFVAAVQQGRTPEIPLREAAKTNLILDAISESSRTGKEVRL